MIEFKGVSKIYGDKVALDNVSFKFEEGKIYGLLGHNGAGKSTTIKILVSIIEQTSGEVLVDGLNLVDHRDEIKQKIGYVSDTPNMFLRLKASEYWDMMANAYKIPADTYQERLDYLVDLFALEDSRDELIEGFSHGMRQKTFLIGALISNPDIWILDEPMTGLDPQAQYDLKDMMHSHAESGNTVVFSTHSLDMAEDICDEIVILRRGHVIFDGTLTDLKDQHSGKKLEEIYLEMAGRQADEEEAAGEQDE